MGSGEGEGPAAAAMFGPSLSLASPQRNILRWTLVYALMLLVTALTFGAAVGHYFIADDLTNLRFIRTFDGSWWDFWVPGRAYSAPVTQSRYMPLHVLYWGALNAAFGDAVWAYHLLSFALHAAVATLMVALGRRLLLLPWGVAAVAGVVFAACRLNTQSVVWVSANFRVLSTASFLLAVLLAPEPSRRSRVAAGLCVFTALFMNADFVVAPAVFAALAWSHRTQRLVAKNYLHAAGASFVMVAAFVAGNLISRVRFPDELALASGVKWDRLAIFILNLLVPYELPLVAKIAVALVLVSIVALHPGRQGLALAMAAGASALFWSLNNYQLAPRYLYLPSIFWLLMLTQSTWLMLRGFSRVPHARWCLAAGLAALVVAANVRAVRRADLVHFEFLAVLPQRLAALGHDAERPKVFLPHNPLPPADLAFFEPQVEFVEAAEQATHIIDLGAAKFHAALGDDFINDYWHMPWLTLALR